MKAFTLIELLVSISILAMVAAISVSAYPKFAEQLSVSTETYKLLAYMREAQVYGSNGLTTSGTKVVYGVEIDRDNNILKRVQWENPSNTTNQSYVDNKVVTGEADLGIGTRFAIDKICENDICESNFTKAYIFFKRPNPEARLIGTVGTIIYPNQNTSTGLQKLDIYIKSKQNSQFVKKIVILQTGQMYVSDW